jgi:hypothetical protein
MPFLDVSSLLLDPDFAQRLTIERRTDQVGANGRTVQTPQIITPKPIGVVLPVDTAIGGNALERNPDEQHRGAALEIITKFRLQGPAPGFQPDVLVYEGNRYIITIVNTLSKYGAGFIRAECSSMDSVDNPPS